MESRKLVDIMRKDVLDKMKALPVKRRTQTQLSVVSKIDKTVSEMAKSVKKPLDNHIAVIS
jgi:nicotinamide mononucleotide (NMN) deamidase PncC